MIAVRYNYEISRYGLLKTWAGKLGYGEAADLLGATLEEEKRADALLTKLAGVPSKPASSAAAAKLKVA